MAILAAKSREDRRPPDKLTMTLSSSTPDIRSAASTASRIAFSAASRSTIAPALTPRERWWPTPSTLQRCVRPRSESERSIGVSRAIRQTIFDAPTSRTESTALLCGGIWRKRGVSGLNIMSRRPSWRARRRAPRCGRRRKAARTRGPACEDRATGYRARGCAIGAAS